MHDTNVSHMEFFLATRGSSPSQRKERPKTAVAANAPKSSSLPPTLNYGDSDSTAAADIDNESKLACRPIVVSYSPAEAEPI